MGQTLSEPVTDKYTTDGKDHRVMYAASAMQGWRISKYPNALHLCIHSLLSALSLVGMEDAHTTIPEYKDTKTSFFAVFDGHGGK